MTEPALSVDTARMLAELGVLDPNDTLATAMQQLVEAAQQILPDTLAVSTTVRHEGEVFTYAASARMAADLDERQYDAGAGPCTDALANGTTTHSPDLTDETRWVELTPQAVAAGVAGMRSTPLIDRSGQHLGALNCYGSVAGGYDRPGVGALADLLAAHASTLLQNQTALESAKALAEQLQEAMASRAIIEQAKGVFVSRLGVSPERAFDYLVRLSQNSHRKLRDVAAGVVNVASSGSGTDSG